MNLTENQQAAAVEKAGYSIQALSMHRIPYTFRASSKDNSHLVRHRELQVNLSGINVISPLGYAFNRGLVRTAFASAMQVHSCHTIGSEGGLAYAGLVQTASEREIDEAKAAGHFVPHINSKA